MKKIVKRTSLLLVAFCILEGGVISTFAQEVFYGYKYRVETKNAAQRPNLGGMPRIDLSDKLIKSGIEGTFKAEMTLASDGKIKDWKFTETPESVKQAIIDAYKKFNFTPASREGIPVDSTLYLEFTVSQVFSERSKGVKKPKIINQPAAEYPPELISEKRKGEVLVGVLFRKDGTLQVLSVSSSMPKEFDKSAVAAAKRIKFNPATHKKSKKKVSLKMMVKYKFKP